MTDACFEIVFGGSGTLWRLSRSLQNANLFFSVVVEGARGLQGESPGGIQELRRANNPPSRGLQGGEGEGSPPLGGRRSEAQGVAGEAQRHRARRLHALRPEASADYKSLRV